MIQRFNALNLWTVTNIVKNRHAADRLYVFEWTIDLCMELLKLHNYHGSYAVFSALTSSTCKRLKKTMQGMTTKRKENLDRYVIFFLLI